MDMVLTVRRQKRNERGAVIVLTAMMLVVLMIMAAFAIDLGNARQVRRQNQAASDASALAGAQDLPGAVNIVATRVERYAAEAIFPGTPPAAPAPICAGATCTYTYPDRTVVTVTTPYNNGAGLNARLVFVKACRPTQRFFAQFAGSGSPTVCRSAVARNIQGITLGQIGIIALQQTAPCTDFDMRGSAASTLNSNGVVIANCEASPPNNFAGANAAINAPTLFAVGACPTAQSCVGSSATTITQIPTAVPDPLAALPDLTTSFAGVIQTTVAGFDALSCLDGIYYVTGTGSVSAIATCPGKTSMVYLVTAGMSDNLKGPVVMVPPASGPYKGVSIFMARGNASSISFNGNSKGEILMGTLYARDGRVDWGGNIDWTVNGQVVADSYSLKGGGGPKNSGFTAVVPSDVEISLLPPDLGLEK